MILAIFFASVILFCLPFVHSATDHNISKSICPKGFSCPYISSPFKYPFYNTTDSQCGLIKVNCNSSGGQIQLGGDSYEIVSKYGSDPLVMIRNRTFERLVNDSNCKAPMNNFTSPTPLLYSISILPFITLYKCTNDSSYAPKLKAYFDQSNYSKYNNICDEHNFYYDYSISYAEVLSDLPPTCQVIQLPVKFRGPDDPQVPDRTNIFSVLGSTFSVSFNLSSSCSECYREDGKCNTSDGQFQCLKKEKPRRKLKQIPVIAGSAFILILFLVIFIIWRRSSGRVCDNAGFRDNVCLIWKLKWRIRTKKYANVEKFLENHEFLAKRYSYLQVKKMTNSFEVKLGQGGFGSVYKGALSNGSLVAVKVLSELKGNGEDFINEVASVGRTSHVNIVSLVGFCFEGHQRALIYEFMPNGSLDKFIYDQAFLGNSQLGWPKLHYIAVGIARGLEYLHSGCNTRILHFNIKPHNILLDQEFSPNISDFGLAKLSPEKRSMISMSHMRGTPGYIAPELFSKSFGQVSHKSDVYSYGMMILEMVGGRKNIEVEVDHTSEIYFPHWIYKKVELDEELGQHTSISDGEHAMIRKMIIVGLWCIQTNPLSRPTITKVLEMLEGDLESLEIPPKPYLSSPLRSVGSSFTQ